MKKTQNLHSVLRGKHLPRLRKVLCRLGKAKSCFHFKKATGVKGWTPLRKGDTMDFKRLLKHADRFFGVLITHVLISQLNYFVLVEYFSSSMIDPTVTDEMTGSLPFILLSALVGLMSLYSVTRLTAIYDRMHMPETIERERNCSNTKERFLCLIEQKHFWIEMALYAAIYLILPLSNGCTNPSQ